MSDRGVCAALTSHGDSLTLAREIDHWAHFPDEASRARFVERVRELGYAIRSLSEDPRWKPPFIAQVWRVDRPAAESIDEITLSLHRAAEEAGGKYDGWESPVIRDSGSA